MNRVKKMNNIQNSLFVVISKSGNTIETLSIIKTLSKKFHSIKKIH